MTRSRVVSGRPGGLAGVVGLAYGAYALAVTVLIAGALWPFIVVVPMPVRWRYRLVRGAGSVICHLTRTPLTIVGSIPANEASLVVANHPSFIDGLVLILAMREPTTIVAGGVFSSQPLIGRFLSRLGCVFTEGRTPSEAILFAERLSRILQAGGIVATFPEGGIEPTREVGNFHLGGLRAAADAGVPVVPVGIAGTHSIVARGHRVPRHGAIHVEIGDPISPLGSDWRSLIALRDATQRAVAALSGEPT